MAEPQHVLVLGAGVVGVTSAYYLARSGCRVTLIEQHADAALETSFANGGLLTPSMSDPWASPGLPRMLLRWIGRENSPFLVRLGALPGMSGWGLRFLRECNPRAWRRNTETIFRLCNYSLGMLQRLVDETGIEYDANRKGTLHLFRDPRTIESSRRIAQTLDELGAVHTVLDVTGCLELEPTLRSQQDTITGGIHYPNDAAGDANLFAQRLARHCASMPVELRYGETVRTLDVRGGTLAAVVTDRERIEADACVVALGTASAALLRPVGIRLPIYPVKGYSITFPVSDWNGAPVVPFVDDVRKIGVVRIGDRVRIAGTAEFAGYDKTLNPHRIGNLKDYFIRSFPDYPHDLTGEPWSGLRPMTPDGIPYLGSTPVRGLYLNTGHGHLGWTMSCGSSAALADLITGRRGELDLTGMTLVDR